MQQRPGPPRSDEEVSPRWALALREAQQVIAKDLWSPIVFQESGALLLQILLKDVEWPVGAASPHVVHIPTQPDAPAGDLELGVSVALEQRFQRPALFCRPVLCQARQKRRPVCITKRKVLRRQLASVQATHLAVFGAVEDRDGGPEGRIRL
eukprot:scaffold1282_cov251-Pinguiococcus_pyrenoidosus.AAC.3